MDALTQVEARVLGSLMEKQVITPDAYPLTLNYLIGACNQKTSREPVLQLSEADVADGIARLRKRMLCIENRMHDSRVLKYSHKLDTLAALSAKEYAALCLLLLRGPQTAGEIRGRAERLADFESVADAEAALVSLSEKSGGPLAQKLARSRGEKEARWQSTLLPMDEGAAAQEAAAAPGLEARVAALEAEVADLKAQIQKLSQPAQS